MEMGVRRAEAAGGRGRGHGQGMEPISTQPCNGGPPPHPVSGVGTPELLAPLS